MNRKKHFKVSFIGIVSLFVVVTNQIAFGQTPLPITNKVPYYINANTAGKSQVFDIQDGLLSIQYEDKHGVWNKINLSVYNWKYENVGNFSMDKTFGVNHYTIDLTTRLSNLEMNQNYFCSFSDEGGNKYSWMFRNIPPVKSAGIVADITINPVHIECGKEFGNLAEFHSQIQNGKAPYVVRWYVMDQQMNKFMYQPKEESVKNGKSSMIQVDKAPGYYVILDITDACGTTARKMVFLDCEQLKKKVNTVFVEPVRQGTGMRRTKPN